MKPVLARDKFRGFRKRHLQGCNEGHFYGQFLFRILDLVFFCLVVALSDQVLDVDDIHYICQLQTASGNLFRKNE